MRTGLIVVALLVLPVSPSWAQQDMLQALQIQRGAKPTPMSKAQLSDMLNRAAAQVPGWAMLRKDSGNNCPTPYPGVSISCDWLFNVATQYGWDFIVDAENAAVIQAGNNGPLQPGQELVMPWPVDGGGGGGGDTGGTAITKLDLQRLEDSVVQRTQNLIIDVQAQLERMFGCIDGHSPDGSPCATAQDNADAIRGISAQIKAHDEKTSKIVAFFSDPKTITAVISSVLAYITARRM